MQPLRAVHGGVTEEGVAPAAEGVVADRHRDGHVDTDHAGIRVSLELAGRPAVPGEDGRAVAVGVVSNHAYRLVVTVNPNYRQNRAEDLVCVDTHVGSDPVQQRGAEKEAVAVERLEPPVHHHLGARVGTGPYVTGDPITVFGGDQGAHLGGRVVTGADDQLLHPKLDRFNKRIGDLSDSYDHGNSHAALSGRPVGGRHGGIGGQVQVSVGQDDHMVLSSTQGLDPLRLGGARRVDVASDRGGSHETERRNVGVFEEPVDGDLVAVDQVHHARWKTGLLGQFYDQPGGRGVPLRGLEDEGVPTGHGVGEHP